MLDACSYSFSSPLKRETSKLYQPLLYPGSSRPAASWKQACLLILFSVVLRHLEYASSNIFLRQAKQKRYLGQPLEVLECWFSMVHVWFSIYFPTQGRSWELKVWPQTHYAVLRRALESRCLTFFYQLWYGWFLSYLGCKSFLTGYWTSQKGS